MEEMDANEGNGVMKQEEADVIPIRVNAVSTIAARYNITIESVFGGGISLSRGLRRHQMSLHQKAKRWAYSLFYRVFYIAKNVLFLRYHKETRQKKHSNRNLRRKLYFPLCMVK